MIIFDLKLFNTEETLLFMADECLPVETALCDEAQKHGYKFDDCFIVSSRNRLFLDIKRSFKSQGIKGGDRLILIRKEGC